MRVALFAFDIGFDHRRQLVCFHYNEGGEFCGLVVVNLWTFGGHPADMESNPAKAAFLHELRKALVALYDPRVLRRSPLIRLFGVDQRRDEISALQRIMIDAIEALKPADNVPIGANAWRVYRILYDRYVDQFTQREVAADLALSTRQLRRQERIAQEILADYLWTHYGLEQKASLLSLSSQANVANHLEDERTPSREQELEWLQRTLSSESVDARKMIEAVLEIAHPLISNLRVHVLCDIPAGMVSLSVPLMAVRQALLHVITVAASCVPGGRVNITAEALPQRVLARLRITAWREEASIERIGNMNHENLEMAQQLIRVANGSLETRFEHATRHPFVASITLPTTEQVPVLVIDDNVDTLQLIQRYLSNSRYRFVGTADPQQALALAEQVAPAVVILDVMLPGVDGWELLGRLREHPKTRAVPIIVCTILPQKQLALMLGAAEFIRKPVSRKTLLSALDRQMDRWLITSR